MIDPHRARRPRDCGMRSSLRATYMLHLLALIDVQWRSMSSINVYMQVFYTSTLITLPGSSPVGGAKFPLSNTKRDYLRFVYFSSGIQSLSGAVEVLLIHRRIKPVDGHVRDPSGAP